MKASRCYVLCSIIVIASTLLSCDHAQPLDEGSDTSDTNTDSDSDSDSDTDTVTDVDTDSDTDNNSEGNNCNTAIPFEVPGTISGNTAGASDDYKGTCSTYDEDYYGEEYAGILDRVYEFTITTEETWSLEIIQADFDTLIYLRSECENFDSEIACNDDGFNVEYELWSNFNVTLSAGTYFVFVEGYSQKEIGTFTLQVTPV